MEFKLPPLPYDFGALEPYIDAQTMEIHHDKHHAKYVEELNKAVQGQAELADKNLEQLLTNLTALPEAVRTAIRNNGGGHYNHSLFWLMMRKGGGGHPQGVVAQAIKQQFGTFEQFQELFNTAAKKVFGSGWAWLVMTRQGNLDVISTANQDSPISQGMHPLLGLDVWEHAYYLKYQNKRPDYISAWWHVINWDFVYEQYEKVR